MSFRKLKFWLPAGLFVILAILLAVGLTLNPREVPSPLIGRAAPQFQLTLLSDADRQFSPNDMLGQVWVLNVWASWCVACREEHEVLRQLASENIAPIVGLNYKDEPDNARQWLADLGDPYLLSVSDQEGRAGIDWGVYGVPETFIIDRQGRIQYKHIGPVDIHALRETLIPTLRALSAKS